MSISSPILITLLVFTAASSCDGQNSTVDNGTVLPISKSNNTIAILWITIGAALLVAVVAMVMTFLVYYQRRIKLSLKMILPLHRKSDQTYPVSSKLLDAINFGPRRFSYAELRVATNDFSEAKLLGRGGFGSVYKGVVILKSANENGRETTVAIKRMAKDSKQGEREFHAEVLSIGLLRHRNVASLLGWCHERDELLLVYEFMANGSLDQHLHHKSSGYPTLPWPSRFKILQGIASALDYLQDGWDKCVVHRDIKPSNVLLDSRMTARLGDFGLARLARHTVVPSEQNPNSKLPVESNVGGTLGYMAPEVCLYGKVTKKADIYSFGMLALEVVCGRRPPGFHSEDGDECLVERVWSAYRNGHLLDVMDPCLHGNMNSSEVQQQVRSVLHLGLLCTLLDPALRPPANRLLQGLNGDWHISLPASKLDSNPPAMSLTSGPSSPRNNYAVYFGAKNFSYAELRAATEDFSDSRLVDKGSYSHVYKGLIPSDSNGTNIVAIKRVSPNPQGEEFHAEILHMIGRSRHRNLVSLLGWCYENGELLLVYEFLENGSLTRHLHPTDPALNPLPWTSRFKILQGVAAALDYLHSGCHESSSILHKAIRPSNVMLDNQMTAKLADFGVNRITRTTKTEAEHSAYLPPELTLSSTDQEHSASSVKSDVYSFGILALEVVSGRSCNEGLVQWVRSMHERGELLDVIDPALGISSAAFIHETSKEGSFDFHDVKRMQQITRVLQLGIACTQQEAELRPHSKRLIQALYGDWSVSLPFLPPYYAGLSVSFLPSESTSFEAYSSAEPLLSHAEIAR